MEVDTLPDTAQCKSCAQVVPVSDCVRVNKHRLSEKVTAYKCRSCNRLQSRINRMQASSDMQIAFPDAAAREAFFKKHQESFGEDLKAALEVVTIETRSHTSTDKLAEEGDWLDEVDLTEKYKSKPEQLKSMLQNAKRMEHPTRKVTLFFDANFKSTATEELEEARGEGGCHFRDLQEGTPQAQSEGLPRVEEEEGKAAPVQKTDGQFACCCREGRGSRRADGRPLGAGCRKQRLRAEGRLRNPGEPKGPHGGCRGGGAPGLGNHRLGWQPNRAHDGAQKVQNTAPEHSPTFQRLAEDGWGCGQKWCLRALLVKEGSPLDERRPALDERRLAS